MANSAGHGDKRDHADHACIPYSSEIIALIRDHCMHCISSEMTSDTLLLHEVQQPGQMLPSKRV